MISVQSSGAQSKATLPLASQFQESLDALLAYNFLFYNSLQGGKTSGLYLTDSCFGARGLATIIEEVPFELFVRGAFTKKGFRDLYMAFEKEYGHFALLALATIIGKITRGGAIY